MKPVIERGLDPVFVVRWPADLTEDEVRAHFADVRSILKQGRQAAFVVDMRAAGPTSASLRRLAAADLKQLFRDFQAQVAGVAHVVESPWVLGILTAVYWLSPPPFPTLNTAHEEQAISWATGRLAAMSPALGSQS